ncbi:high affinity cationic amino acid transporter 1-like [Betta splendens]|uniref:High affinity cationic amino acid transporter 1-like n=1 Tax=Betta splendens TaxID=158456 RepID=A0A6P7P3L6_BETSP|nr:high affinity cationic amino acid transporter 1-like [Betta splendens]
MSLAALRGLGEQLVRLKAVDADAGDARLSRCLGPLDLAALGVGSTLGAGAYVLAGAVARDDAGPAVLLSFCIAALASVLAGLCYAELGARVPRTGSAYLYSYVAVGELWAFITGWNLILSYVTGSSSVARAWSAAVDEIFGKSIEGFCRRHVPLNAPRVLAEYADPLAVLIVLALTGLLVFGVKQASAVNKGLTCLNVLVLLFVVVCGFVKGNLENWRLNPEEILNATRTSSVNTSVPLPSDGGLGAGGFMPFGFSGVLSGAATCFYAFVGFDVIAAAGGEAEDPRRAVPVGTAAALLLCCAAYAGVAAATTLMVPYYALDSSRPLPAAFEHVGWEAATRAVAVGSVSALSTSLLGSMFPLPRIIYAMARDGLLFKFLARVSSRRTPVNATLVAGLMSSVVALLFDTKDLVALMSIGTLLAYTMVAACVLVLRYQPTPSSAASALTVTIEETECAAAEQSADGAQPENGFSPRQLFVPLSAEPTPLTGFVVKMCTCALGVLVCLFSVVASEVGLVLCSASALCFLSVLCLTVTVIMCRQPQRREKLGFQVPLLPFIPVTSVLVNVYLMTQLSRGAWVRVSIWMLSGFLIYFGYGIRNSSAARSNSAASCTRGTVGPECIPLRVRQNASAGDDRVWEAH